MELKITYEIKGKERRKLAQAISEILNIASTYKGVPTFEYEIGDLIVDREGSIILNESMAQAEIEDLVSRLQEKGFKPINYKEDTFEGFEVAMPRDMFTDKALENLRKIVNAKGELISKALEVVGLSIIETDEKVIFPWYPQTEDADEIKYYLQFTEALCKMAIERTRVTSKARISENEKYDFRCFLLSLGFIGKEYKDFRKYMMRNLTGNSAFKNGKK